MPTSNPHLLAPKDFVDSAEAMNAVYSLPAAESYTRWLATHHYENFHVVSFLLPKHLHQDFYNVYAFCRWADDLGDELGDPQRSLTLLNWWREGLDSMYSGEANHPVFVALSNTAKNHSIPADPFADLIKAFVQDQSVTRYRTMDELLDYCRYSANPVGRLVLHLCGYVDEKRRAWSDSTCSALQLANFWQDVTVDWQKDRVYIPLDVLERHGATVDDIAARRATPEFREAMKEVTDYAQSLFEAGLPLIPTVDRRLAVDLDLFSRGGMRILAKIRSVDYDVLSARPAVSKIERVSLLLSAVVRQAFAPRAA